MHDEPDVVVTPLSSPHDFGVVANADLPVWANSPGDEDDHYETKSERQAWMERELAAALGDPSIARHIAQHWEVGALNAALRFDEMLTEVLGDVDIVMELPAAPAGPPPEMHVDATTTETLSHTSPPKFKPFRPSLRADKFPHVKADDSETAARGHAAQLVLAN